jgi:ABC-type nitrate/sulfonate/bicarbonate transport system permease component
MVMQLEGGRVRRLGMPSGSAVEAIAWPVASLALLALFWELIARIVDVSFIPSFLAVMERLIELLKSGAIFDSLLESLSNLAIGLVIAVVLGTVIGALMGMSAKFNAALDLYVNILLITPKLIFAPLLFGLFGLGRIVLIILVVLFALVYIIMNTADAMRLVSASLIEMAETLNASKWQIFVKIIVPSSVPMMMTGFLVAVPRAVKGMIYGEMFLAAVGLGAIVISAGKQFDATTVLAMFVFIISLAFCLLGLFNLLERRVRTWLPTPATTTTGR